MNEQHYRIFDLWRFTAACLVMVYHYLYAAPVALWALVAPIMNYGYGLLDLFFMISGFLVMARYGEKMDSVAAYGRLLRRRFASLYPLHFVTLSFFVLVAMAGHLGLFSFANPERWVLSELPAHLLLVNAWGTSDVLAFNIPAWSVSAEFFCYFLFPVVLAVVRWGGTAGTVLFLILYAVLLEALFRAGLLGERHWTMADNFGAYRALFSFSIGVLLARVNARSGLLVTSLWPASLLILSTFAVMLMGAPPAVTLAGFALALFLGARAETVRPDITGFLKPAQPLLRLSFGIYLWHMVFDLIFFSLVWKRIIDSQSVPLFLLFSLVPIGVTLATAFLSSPVEAWVSRRLSGPIAGGRLARA